MILLEACNLHKNLPALRKDVPKQECDCKYYQNLADKEYADSISRLDDEQKKSASLNKIKTKRTHVLLHNRFDHPKKRKGPKPKDKNHCWKDFFRKNISACPSF